MDVNNLQTGNKSNDDVIEPPKKKRRLSSVHQQFQPIPMMQVPLQALNSLQLRPMPMPPQISNPTMIPPNHIMPMYSIPMYYNCQNFAAMQMNPQNNYNYNCNYNYNDNVNNNHNENNLFMNDTNNSESSENKDKNLNKSNKNINHNKDKNVDNDNSKNNKHHINDNVNHKNKDKNIDNKDNNSENNNRKKENSQQTITRWSNIFRGKKMTGSMKTDDVRYNAMPSNLKALMHASKVKEQPVKAKALFSISDDYPTHYLSNLTTTQSRDIWEHRQNMNQKLEDISTQLKSLKDTLQASNKKFNLNDKDHFSKLILNAKRTGNRLRCEKNIACDVFELHKNMQELEKSQNGIKNDIFKFLLTKQIMQKIDETMETDCLTSSDLKPCTLSLNSDLSLEFRKVIKYNLDIIKMIELNEKEMKNWDETLVKDCKSAKLIKNSLKEFKDRAEKAKVAKAKNAQRMKKKREKEKEKQRQNKNGENDENGENGEVQSQSEMQGNSKIGNLSMINRQASYGTSEESKTTILHQNSIGSARSEVRSHNPMQPSNDSINTAPKASSS